MQPTLVTESALKLATECVRMILKIDDLVKIIHLAYLLFKVISAR